MSRQVGFLFIMGVLMCALSTLEIPELLQLVDNTSNDYSTVIFQKNTSSTLATQFPDVARLVLLAPRAVRPDIPNLQILPFESLNSVPDLLRLFCVLRT